LTNRPFTRDEINRAWCLLTQLGEFEKALWDYYEEPFVRLCIEELNEPKDEDSPIPDEGEIPW
jgi:hypothetical protein